MIVEDNHDKKLAVMKIKPGEIFKTERSNAYYMKTDEKSLCGDSYKCVNIINGETELFRETTIAHRVNARVVID